MDKLKHSILCAKEKIELLRKEDSLVFPIFTDLHTSGVDCEWTVKLCEVLNIITDEIQCDFVVNLGDNTGMLGRNEHVSNSDLEKILSGILDRIYGSINCPLFTVNGNHDAIGTDFFKPDFWNGIVKNKYGNESAVYDTEGSYYYVDFKNADTRFVVLSVPSDSDLEAKYPTPCWKFGENQLLWLKNKALKFKGNVIILMHVPFYYEDNTYNNEVMAVWNGQSEAMSYITDLCGRIEDLEEAVEIINEFNERTDANLVACFSGHTHVDSVWEPLEEKICEGYSYINPLPCKQVVTAGTFIPAKEHEKFGISIDIAVWTPSCNELNIIRVGDGMDREIIKGTEQ